MKPDVVTALTQKRSQLHKLKRQIEEETESRVTSIDMENAKINKAIETLNDAIGEKKKVLDRFRLLQPVISTCAIRLPRRVLQGLACVRCCPEALLRKRRWTGSGSCFLDFRRNHARRSGSAARNRGLEHLCFGLPRFSRIACGRFGRCWSSRRRSSRRVNWLTGCRIR